MLSFVFDLFKIELEDSLLILNCKTKRGHFFEVLRFNHKKSKIERGENLDCFLGEMDSGYVNLLCFTKFVGEEKSLDMINNRTLFSAYIKYVLKNIHSGFLLENLDDEIEHLYDFIILCLFLENDKNAISILDNYL